MADHPLVPRKQRRHEHVIQGYFAVTKVRRPQRQAKSIRVSIPASQRVSLKAIATIRVLKLNVFR